MPTGLRLQFRHLFSDQQGFFLDNPVLLFSMLSCVLYAGTNHSEVVMYEVSGGAPPIQ